MLINLNDPKQKHLILRLALILSVVITIIAIIQIRIVGSDREQIPPLEVWDYIQAQAPEQDLDPEFVYAIVWAESSLKPKAQSSVARGMMQLTRPAWIEVSDEPYRQAWDWRTNIRVGIDYLGYCRDYLEKHDSFSYPLLAASYRYGPYHVRKKDFKIKRLKKPKNKIYRRIFEGDTTPVPPPLTN